jgi:neurofibromin 1
MRGRYPCVRVNGGRPRKSYESFAKGESVILLSNRANMFKLLALTHAKPSISLPKSQAWSDICALARLNLKLAFDPATEDPLATQLFLPELLHVITILLGNGTLLVRQTLYGLITNTLQSLANASPTGEMDTPGLRNLLTELRSLQLMTAFGLKEVSGQTELIVEDEKEVQTGHVLVVANFCTEILSAAAVSTGEYQLLLGL